MAVGALALKFSFSPLFIGASRSIVFHKGYSTRPAHVSVPSSLGHRVQPSTGGFSPGFRVIVSVPSSLGHRVQRIAQVTYSDEYFVSVPSSLGHRVQPSTNSRSDGFLQWFQSPLHWGIAFNLQQGFKDLRNEILFQSPLHWGIAFNSLDAGRWLGRSAGFSPLFIGASRSTSSRNQPILSIVGFSPLFIGASRSTRAISVVNQPCKLFQSPLHWGIAFNSNCRPVRASNVPVSVPSSLGHRVQPEFRSRYREVARRFSPLFIGASRSTGLPDANAGLPDQFSPLFIGASRST